MVETEVHRRMKERLAAEYSRLGFNVEFEKILGGHRWDLALSSPSQRILIECETLTPQTSLQAAKPPEGWLTYLYVPDWFGKFDALLIDGPNTVTLNEIRGERELSSKILASSISAETLKREIASLSSQPTTTTSYRIAPTTRSAFKSVCSALGLDQSPILDWLMRTFVTAFVGQTKLELFTYPNLEAAGHITIIQPRTVNIAVKAELTYCKLELSRLLGVLETCPANNRRDFLKELTKVLIQASRIQVTTQDQELGDLLAKAEVHLK